MNIVSLFEAIAAGGLLERVERTRIEDITVSTVLTRDAGYETALVAAETYVVERYADREQAVAGHAAWVRRIESGERTFTDVGYGSLKAPQEFSL